jgi:CheY-like chemotaxis protein
MEQPRPVLLVEDNENDLYLTLRLFQAAAFPFPIEVAHDGVEALKRLQAADPPLPLLAVVDLKMPRMGGLELIEHIRKDPRLTGLRVLILTSSSHFEDRRRAKELGVEDYLIKPVALEGMDAVIARIRELAQAAADLQP